MEKRIAIIDCGTNTFHLMISKVQDGQITTILKDKLVVKIGEGGINEKIITSAAYSRALNSLITFKAKINEYKVNAIYAFATSAFRNAVNSSDLTQSIYQKTGITIQIIPGWKEAELIYHGVNSALTIGQKPALIMDIGGGSVEFIIGTDTQILWKQSYEIGAQRLVSLFHTNDPITPNEIKALNQYLKDQLHDLIHVLNNYQVKTLIGSSGTFDTLSEIYCAREKLDSDENQSEISFDKAAFSSIYQSILTKNRAQRLRIPGMVAMRVDMIVVACALIDFLLKQHKFNRVRVTTYALKEGILDRLIHNQL